MGRSHVGKGTDDDDKQPQPAFRHEAVARCIPILPRPYQSILSVLSEQTNGVNLNSAVT